MATRMKDIAQDLGLSIVTVSKALRNHPDIAEETRARVLKRVKELDYRPNILARGLVTGRSFLIGLVVPDLLHPFFAEVAKALSSVVAERGYSVIISSSEEDDQLEAREIEQLVSRQLDALVIASSSSDTAAFARMDRFGHPYVLIDREFPGFPANFVGIDDEAAGRLATNHLIDQGCERIAHIRGRENSTGIRRFNGYCQALEDWGLPFLEEYVVARNNVDTKSDEMGREAMQLLLKLRPIPDGVFCYNDPLAIGAANAILEAGLRIPEDIALVRCGNLHYNSSLRVPLSSIDQHSQLIGERAGHMTLDLIEQKVRPQPMSLILEPSLVMRKSSNRSGSRNQESAVRRTGTNGESTG
jgi:LacI family transcriptional regulator